MVDEYLTKNFIERAKKIHKNIYDYSKVSCTKYDDYVTIICKHHGEFSQLAYSHITGRGCARCGRMTSSEEFKAEIKEKHSLEYDLNSHSYTHNREQVTVTCPSHGVITEEASLILYRGCSRCRFPIRYLFDFLLAAYKIHGVKFSYPRLPDFISTKDRIEVICKDCDNTFDVSVANHIYKKSGCPKCRYKLRSIKNE